MDVDLRPVMISFFVENALILAFVSLASYFLLKPYLDPKRKKLPPGPTGVPILGYIPFMQSEYGERLKQLYAKHGKIVSMRLGSFDVVFISDFEVIKKISKMDTYNHRPEHWMLSITPIPNLVNWNGEVWKEQRKFSLRIMRDLGMGKQGFEDAILDEVNDLMRLVDKESGKPITVHPFLGSSVSNVLNHMIMGKSLASDHPTRQLIDEAFLQRGNGTRPSMWSPFFYIPILAKVMRNAPFSPIKIFGTRGYKILDYMRSCFSGIQKDFDWENSEVTCFMEAYYKEMRINPSGKSFDEYHMLGDAFSFFAAGSNTTGDYMTWFFLLMMADPAIQRKVRQEIDDVIGSNQTSAKYRNCMPYTEAVMHELHRMSSTTPSGLPHAVADDVWLEGYFLPKGTQVIFHIDAVHMNPEYFERPEDFIPERHISAEGKFVRNEKIMPFGFGKRSCPGEPIANAQIFLYVTSFLQKFEILPPKGRKYGMKGVMDFLGRIPADSPVQVLLKKR